MKKILFIIFTSTLIACEDLYSPELPYIVVESRLCGDCKALYLYKVRAAYSPQRTTEFISDEIFSIGDTLQICRIKTE